MRSRRRPSGNPADPARALAHLLPADLVPGIGVGEEERATLFHAARAGLTKRADGQRLVLAVDDVDRPRLFLSARTVDTQLAPIYRKLGVTGRAELADALDARVSPS